MRGETCDGGTTGAFATFPPCQRLLMVIKGLHMAFTVYVKSGIRMADLMAERESLIARHLVRFVLSRDAVVYVKGSDTDVQVVKKKEAKIGGDV